jgi:uncharacterized protein YndB with AHSA1/START domain
MEKARFDYVTYISAPPEKLWRALTEPATTTLYWQHVNVSDWKPGSRWEHRRDGPAGEVLMAGKVVESRSPRRLVITWASPEDVGRPEKESRVAFELEALGETTRLSLAHEGLEPGSQMLEGVSDGWPKVLSSLKTLMETGRSLPRLW